ncbi:MULTISPECIES: DUF742 domain-containing protein [Saccharopolyspora]|uniref:DUF742 domain-containing protein n=1 Tax=Saccharopolyspora cebuensis TaxID=418759 RepID=A0ABV4CPA3_9PSEU
MSPAHPRRDLVRSYVVTAGRARPDDPGLDPATLVRAEVRQPPRGLGPQQHRVVEVCCGGTLAVAEVAAHAGLPVTVAAVVIGDLVADGWLSVRAAAPQGPSAAVLEEVLRGLRDLDTAG